MSWIEDPEFATGKPFGPQTLPYGVLVTGSGPVVAVRVGRHALPLRGIADRAGVPIGGDGGVQAALTRDPVLDAAASVATLSRRRTVRDDAFAAAIAALRALDAQHAAYAERKPVSARDAAATLERLAAVTRAAEQ